MLEHIFDRNVFLLERSLDLRLARQNLLAANVANAETPGYRAVDLDFKQALSEVVDRLDAAESGDQGALAGAPVRARVVVDDGPAVGNNGNTVEVEREIGKLSENAIMFKAQALFLGKKLQMIKEAVGGS
ncbi:MAG: flagellar basal body rod protein FlgB [Candidatus Sumerlaeota bacterium]|nr:flagellar basal body rod protein FlgB [Candidatus Sumerlaeota bacterium]